MNAFGAVFIFLFGYLLSAWIGYPHWVELGRIQVASGEYVCQLVEQPDKTSEWECE